MIFYIYNIGVDLYNGFNGLRHRINWTYFTVLDGLAHPLYSQSQSLKAYCEKFHPKKAIRFSTLKYMDQEWMVNIPLYAISKLQE